MQGIANLRPSLAATAARADADDKHKDLGLAGFILLAQFHDIAVDARQLAHQYGRVGELFVGENTEIILPTDGIEWHFKGSAVARGCRG